MTEFKMPPVSMGKAIFGAIIALILGAAFPVLLTVELSMMMPMILISNIVMPVIYVAYGRFAAATLVIAELAFTLFFLGDSVAVMVFAASVLPGVMVIWGMSKRKHFFDQLQTGLIAHFLGLVVAVTIAYFNFGGDMIQKFIDAIRQQVALIPDDWFLPLVESVNEMIAALTDGSVDPKSLVTVESYRTMLSGTMMDVMQEMYVQYLPGCLLTGAVLTAILSVLWGNWRMARKGLATSESFIGLSKWNVPVNVSAGVFIIWFVGYIIAGTGAYSAGSTVYTAIYMLAQMVFYVQAFAGFDRMLIGRFVGLRGRRVLIALVFVGALIMPLINMILLVYGGGSMFMGIVNAVKAAIKKKMDEDDDNSDNM